MDHDGKVSPRSCFTLGNLQVGRFEVFTVKDIHHPLLKYHIETIKFKLPPKDKSIGLIFARCNFHNLPYITKSQSNSKYNKTVSVSIFHKVWILVIENIDPITPHHVEINENRAKISTGNMSHKSLSKAMYADSVRNRQDLHYGHLTKIRGAHKSLKVLNIYLCSH